MAREKKIEFEISIDEKTPPRIHTDLQRLEQILRNLLSNAFKFTPAGKVHLRIQPSTIHNQVEFAVIDTGIGIASDKYGVIFEAFRQADGTTNRRFGGTGLGLSISKDLSALLGGKLEVTSELGKGSTFLLTLPTEYQEVISEKEDSLSAASRPFQSSPPAISSVKSLANSRPGPQTGTNSPATSRTAPPISPTPPRKKTEKNYFSDDRANLKAGDRVVLVVEDDITFVRFLFDLAHEQKFKCVVAETADEAIELANSIVPSAVLLDMKLPDHSGLMVLDQIKQSPRTRHIPVHVVSASDYSRQAVEMGAIGHIQKPAKKEELVEVFNQLENKIHQRIRKVLIIEDDKVQREAIQRLIAGTQVETKAVALGTEALNLLKSDNFDCMIMDLILPDMSGFELLKRMTEDEKNSYPPVIIYTARELTREEEDRLRNHSQSVIIKGARSPERLLDEVTLFLHKVENATGLGSTKNSGKLAQPRKNLRGEIRFGGGRRYEKRLRSDFGP